MLISSNLNLNKIVKNINLINYLTKKLAASHKQELKHLTKGYEI